MSLTGLCPLRWNKYLGKFVTSLCKHLNKRLAKEANAASQRAEEGSGQSKAQREGSGAAQHGRQELTTDMQRRLAKVILRMADKAQYSKVSDKLKADTALLSASFIAKTLSFSNQQGDC